jgi:hypothetical protein
MPKLTALDTISREIAFARAVVDLARAHGMLPKKVGRPTRRIAGAGKTKATPKKTRRPRRTRAEVVADLVA